jgi:hypothetical protein
MREFFFTLLTLSFTFSCTPSDKGLEIYLVKKDFPNCTSKLAGCCYCIDPSTKDLYEKPLLVESDIECFDWTNQQIELTDTGFEKIKNLEIPLRGLAAAIVVDGQPIYGFWFWNVFSSFGCDRVFTYPKLDFKIDFGLGVSTKGQDPRFDSRIKECLIQSGLLK